MWINKCWWHNSFCIQSIILKQFWEGVQEKKGRGKLSLAANFVLNWVSCLVEAQYTFFVLFFEISSPMWPNRGFRCHVFPRITLLPGFFLCIFSSLTCLKEPVFSKLDLLWWKIPTSLSLFLKGEQLLALLYLGKGHQYKPFRDSQRVPSAYRPRAHISNGEGLVLRPFSYI